MTAPALNFRLLLVIVTTALLHADFALAEEPQTWRLMFERDEPRIFDRFPEVVDEEIKVSGGWYTMFSSTTVWQHASESQTDLDNLLNTFVRFSGGWAVTDTANLAWWVQGGRPVGESRDANLSEAIGSELDINGGLISTAFDIQELYWAQKIGEKFRFSFGMIDTTWRYDASNVANSDTEAFLSASLTNSPAIPFPDRSLGLDFLWTANDMLAVHAGWYQTSCQEGDSFCIKELESDEWLLPVEIIAKPSLFNLEEGIYKVLFFESKSGDDSGNGWSVNIEQPLGPVIGFARASLSDKDIADIHKFLSFGIAIDGVANRNWDRIGIGYARGTPSDADLRTETIIETYWRFQLNPFVAITPDVQLVIDPADNPDENKVWVVGARLQLDF